MSPSRKPRSERPTRRRPIRVVPMRGIGGLVAPAARVAAPPAAQLTYRGGPLLTGVEVVTVYWGAAWNEAPAQATAQSLNAFFQFVVSSPYIDQLGEYNTPQQKIGRGRYAGTARVTDTAPSASVTDSAIQQMLEGEVARKSVPAGTANTLYFADLQPLDALTSVCSHELAEAITDPVPGQGWYDDTSGEIGDICAWQNKKLGAYEVQLLWSNRAKACV